MSLVALPSSQSSQLLSLATSPPLLAASLTRLVLIIIIIFTLVLV